MVSVMAYVVLGMGLVAAGVALHAAAGSLQTAPAQDGSSVYLQHCASCHGAHGEGARNWQQPNAAGEMPAPPHDARGHTWKHSDAMLYRIVQEGWRDPFNKSDRLTMPPFKDQLSRDDTVAVITYLKALWTTEQRSFQAEESRGRPFPQAKD